MHVLITGSQGFIGKNLVIALEQLENINILTYDKDTPRSNLKKLIAKSNFIFHFAGVNRPETEEEFIDGNVNLTAEIIQAVQENKRNIPILMTSSIHAEQLSAYGKSKLQAENLLFAHKAKTNYDVYIYRLPNVFGKFSRPFYNSVVATFCYNIARNKPIKIDNEQHLLSLVYIDDCINEFINALKGHPTMTEDGFCKVAEVYSITVGKLAETIYSFAEARKSLFLPNLNDPLSKYLYSTYLHFLDQKNFSYPLKMHVDDRGSFTEFFKTIGYGQVSLNVSKPNVTKGNHWHHTKVEKFLVVSGKASIKFKSLFNDEVIEYIVSGEKLEIIDIPVGYTHNITNIGKNDLVTVMWANEVFDKDNPDTYFLEVEK